MGAKKERANLQRRSERNCKEVVVGIHLQNNDAKSVAFCKSRTAAAVVLVAHHQSKMASGACEPHVCELGMTECGVSEWGAAVERQERWPTHECARCRRWLCGVCYGEAVDKVDPSRCKKCDGERAEPDMRRGGAGVSAGPIRRAREGEREEPPKRRKTAGACGGRDVPARHEVEAWLKEGLPARDNAELRAFLRYAMALRQQGQGRPSGSSEQNNKIMTDKGYSGGSKQLLQLQMQLLSAASAVARQSKASATEPAQPFAQCKAEVWNDLKGNTKALGINGPSWLEALARLCCADDCSSACQFRSGDTCPRHFMGRDFFPCLEAARGKAAGKACERDPMALRVAQLRKAAGRKDNNDVRNAFAFKVSAAWPAARSALTADGVIRPRRGAKVLPLPLPQAPATGAAAAAAPATAARLVRVLLDHASGTGAAVCGYLGMGNGALLGAVPLAVPPNAPDAQGAGEATWLVRREGSSDLTFDSHTHTALLASAGVTWRVQTLNNKVVQVPVSVLAPAHGPAPLRAPAPVRASAPVLPLGPAPAPLIAPAPVPASAPALVPALAPAPAAASVAARAAEAGKALGQALRRAFFTQVFPGGGSQEELADKDAATVRETVQSMAVFDTAFQDDVPAHAALFWACVCAVLAPTTVVRISDIAVDVPVIVTGAAKLIDIVKHGGMETFAPLKHGSCGPMSVAWCAGYAATHGRAEWKFKGGNGKGAHFEDTLYAPSPKDLHADMQVRDFVFEVRACARFANARKSVRARSLQIRAR